MFRAGQDSVLNRHHPAPGGFIENQQLRIERQRAGDRPDVGAGPPEKRGKRRAYRGSAGTTASISAAFSRRSRLVRCCAPPSVRSGLLVRALRGLSDEYGFWNQPLRLPLKCFPLVRGGQVMNASDAAAGSGGNSTSRQHRAFGPHRDAAQVFYPIPLAQSPAFFAARSSGRRFLAGGYGYGVCASRPPAWCGSWIPLRSSRITSSGAAEKRRRGPQTAGIIRGGGGKSLAV